MKYTRNARSFGVAMFTDAGNDSCILQASSAIDPEYSGSDSPGTSCVWLGRENGDRMHLNRVQVADLIQAMSRWLATGEFSDG